MNKVASAVCWHDYNVWTRAVRIVGQLVIAAAGSVYAAVLSFLLTAYLYDGLKGGDMYCEAPLSKCAFDGPIIGGGPPLFLLFVAAIAFAWRPLSNWRTTLREILVRFVPVVTILATLFTAALLAAVLPLSYLTYALWHMPGFAAAAFTLLLLMTLWRRLWVTTRSRRHGAEN